MSSLQPEFCWNLVVPFCPGVPRSPSCTGAGGVVGLDARFLLGPVSSQVPRLFHYRAVSPHPGRKGTPPRARTMPHWPSSLRPHSRQEGGSEMLWFPSGPHKLVLGKPGSKASPFRCTKPMLTPLDRKEQETCLCAEKEGKERKRNSSRSHPPHLTGPAPVPLQLSLREAPAFALLAVLRTEASASGS